jgi:hypothetical protein
MKDLLFIREECGYNVFFNPNTGENENVKDKSATTVNLFVTDGEVVAECGETYQEPMTAENTNRIETFEVKAGAMTCGFQFKKLISEPEKVTVNLLF